MRQLEHGFATATIWLGFAGTGLIATLLLTMMVLDGPRFNLGGILIVTAMVITYIAVHFFSRHLLNDGGAASLLGLSLAILGQFCIVTLTITSVGLLLLPAALTSLGLLAVAALNQVKLINRTG